MTKTIAFFQRSWHRFEKNTATKYLKYSNAFTVEKGGIGIEVPIVKKLQKIITTSKPRFNIDISYVNEIS